MRLSSVGEAGTNFIASSFLAFKNKKEKKETTTKTRAEREAWCTNETKLMGVVEVKVFT